MAHQYLNTQQAADYVGQGTNPRTIVAWMKAGKLKFVRNPSVRGRYKTTTEWIDEALKAGADSQAGSDARVPRVFEVSSEVADLLARTPVRFSADEA